MGSQALAIESFLEGSSSKKPGGLLSGLGAKLHRASDLAAREPSPSPLAPCPGIEQLLEGSLTRGKLIELVGCRSSGRFSIGLAALASRTSRGEPAALVDLGEHLDPQAAVEAGVDLELLLWVRPRRVKEALASAEMLLAAGFPLVVADLGLSPRGARYVPDAAWLRLSRAARSRGSSLLLLTPWRMSGIASDAVIAADAPRPLWRGSGKSPRLLTGLSSRLTLQKLARATPAATILLSLDVEASLASSKGGARFAPAHAQNLKRLPGLSITNHKSPITNAFPSIPLEIRDSRPQIRNGAPAFQLTTRNSQLTTPS